MHSVRNESAFLGKLRKELSYLRQLDRSNSLCDDETWQVGLELEAWILDHKLQPMMLASRLVEAIGSEELSVELIDCILEINLKPLRVDADILCNFTNRLQTKVDICRSWLLPHGGRLVTIGMIPHLSPQSFKDHMIVPLQRYKKLLAGMDFLRQARPWQIDIEGQDRFSYLAHDLALEAAATSTQFHLKVPNKNFGSAYHISQLLAPMIAGLSANSPIFDHKVLWQETRIPWVAQTASTIVDSGCNFNRQDNHVTLGQRFCENSPLDLFEDGFCYPLVDTTLTETEDPLHHLRSHNSMIWRWNRPVIGGSLEEGYHLRLEHRVQSAGTSVQDITGQLAFFLGLQAYYLSHESLSDSLNFDQLRSDFYESSRYGLDAKVHWDGQQYLLRTLLLSRLLDYAKQGLSSLGVNATDTRHYIDDVLRRRILAVGNGSDWQLAHSKSGSHTIEMLAAYCDNQESGRPLAEW